MVLVVTKGAVLGPTLYRLATVVPMGEAFTETEERLGLVEVKDRRRLGHRNVRLDVHFELHSALLATRNGQPTLPGNRVFAAPEPEAQPVFGQLGHCRHLEAEPPRPRPEAGVAPEQISAPTR